MTAKMEERKRKWKRRRMGEEKTINIKHQSKKIERITLNS